MYSSRLALDGSQLRSDSALSGSISPHVRAPELALVSKWKGPDIQTLLRAPYASSSQSAAAGKIHEQATTPISQRKIFAPALMASSRHRGFRNIGTIGGDEAAWIVPSGSKPWRM